MVRFSIAETSAFSVMANTLNLDGGDKSITRSVIKFIIHEKYNPNTYVIAFYDSLSMLNSILKELF